MIESCAIRQLKLVINFEFRCLNTLSFCRFKLKLLLGFHFLIFDDLYLLTHFFKLKMRIETTCNKSSFILPFCYKAGSVALKVIFQIAFRFLLSRIWSHRRSWITRRRTKGWNHFRYILISREVWFHINGCLLTPIQISRKLSYLCEWGQCLFAQMRKHII